MNSPIPTNFDPDCDPRDVPEYDGIYGLPTSPDDAALVLIPVPWEATTSYRGGTSLAPEAIRAASLQVELYDRETGRPYERGIAMTAADPRIKPLHVLAMEAKNANEGASVDEHCRELNAIVFEQTRYWHAKGKRMGIVGGEHSVALGAIQAAAERYGSFGILYVDAHADLRERYQGMQYSHAAFMSNVLNETAEIERVVQVGVRDLSPLEVARAAGDSRIVTDFDPDYRNMKFCDVVESLPPDVWISLDIDGLDPSLCPNTGTPVPGGLRWDEALSLLRAVAESGRRIIGFDLTEVGVHSGGRRAGEGWDEMVAARLLYKLCGWTLATGGTT